jgi:hypothetical protein
VVDGRLGWVWRKSEADAFGDAAGEFFVRKHGCLVEPIGRDAKALSGEAIARGWEATV